MDSFSLSPDKNEVDTKPEPITSFEEQKIVAQPINETVTAPKVEDKKEEKKKEENKKEEKKKPQHNMSLRSRM
jgi:hypothetical protein